MVHIIITGVGRYQESDSDHRVHSRERLLLHYRSPLSNVHTHLHLRLAFTRTRTPMLLNLHSLDHPPFSPKIQRL